MTESTNSHERPPESNGQSDGLSHADADHRVAQLEVGAQVLTDLKEMFAANMAECLRAQQAAESQLRALIAATSGANPPVPIDRGSVLAVRTLHRCLLDRSKLLLNAIRVAKQIDYQKPKARQVREA